MSAAADLRVVTSFRPCLCSDLPISPFFHYSQVDERVIAWRAAQAHAELQPEPPLASMPSPEEMDSLLEQLDRLAQPEDKLAVRFTTTALARKPSNFNHSEWMF